MCSDAILASCLVGHAESALGVLGACRYCAPVEDGAVCVTAVNVSGLGGFHVCFPLCRAIAPVTDARGGFCGCAGGRRRGGGFAAGPRWHERCSPGRLW